MTRVLVVDDDPAIVRALVINLKARSYEVDSAEDGAGALRAATARHPDVVVLDLGLPDMDGVEVIRRLREWTRVPVLVLSARHASAEKVQALDAGADDYVTKPFGMDELLARLRAAVRRAEPVGDGGDVVVETDAFTVDLAAKKVHRDGRDVRLTPTEWHLLEVLVRGGGRLVAQKQLLGRCGGRRTGRRPTTCACTWPSCAANWRPTPRVRGTSSPSPAWGTASRSEAGPFGPGKQGVRNRQCTPVRFRYECCSSVREAGRPVPAHARPALVLAGGPGVGGAARGRRDCRVHADR